MGCNLAVLGFGASVDSSGLPSVVQVKWYKAVISDVFFQDFGACLGPNSIMILCMEPLG